MKTSTHLLTVAVLSAAGIFWSVPMVTRGADATPKPANAMAPDNTAALSATGLPAGITPKELKDQKGIDNALKSVAESMFSRGAVADLVDRVVDQDRERLNQFKVTDKKDLNALVAKLNKAWKDKYGQDFDIDVSKAYPDSYVNILEGEVADTSQLVGNWPVMGNMLSSWNGGKLTAADANRIKDKLFGGDVNLEKGRRVAIAIIQGGDGLPQVTASLIHEDPATWRFDIPNTVTGQQLHDNIAALLNYLNDNQAKWPADVNDGYRYVTHAVVATFYGLDATKPDLKMPPTAMNMNK